MNENIRKAQELIHALVQTNMERFISYGVLSPQWVLLLVLLIVPWLLLAKLIDKKRRFEVLTVGCIVAIVTTLLDIVGYNLSFWDYPIQLVPVVPQAFSFDLSVVPFPYMILYQYCRSWKTYWIGLMAMTLVYAFIGEPFCNWIKVVLYIKWNYTYSVLFYIITGIAVKAFAEKLKMKT